ncbi:hypothetical protein CCHR01_14431 [Colletotrichum chrysophilum]|uniref:Uncharacterized protein n=1 Tax=Colletotrichum chrysophilum TaxID=1836956 RepID=A0AAD9ECS1_9PEZI|nr:hypothetical protein CCHR01_14431 [Colletotrichum chrysophilum]
MARRTTRDELPKEAQKQQLEAPTTHELGLQAINQASKQAQAGILEADTGPWAPRRKHTGGIRWFTLSRLASTVKDANGTFFWAVKVNDGYTVRYCWVCWVPAGIPGQTLLGYYIESSSTGLQIWVHREPFFCLRDHCTGKLDPAVCREIEVQTVTSSNATPRPPVQAIREWIQSGGMRSAVRDPPPDCPKGESEGESLSGCKGAPNVSALSFPFLCLP